MKISILGTGYVGLVTGTCLADSGNEVICTDINKEKIDLLNNGKCPIYEEGLEELIKRNVKGSRLSFITDSKKAVQDSLVNFICVGTPEEKGGRTNLDYIINCAELIGKAIQTDSKEDHKIIVVKSTVPPGTTRKVKGIISLYTEKDFDVASNPEFLKEGMAIEDFQKPDRIVIGADNEKAFKVLRELYAPFVRTGKPILEMKIESAELTKYGANGLLATKISYMNEIANLCEVVGADVDEVRKGIGSDPRIGTQFLFPGIGYGGSCFPKDIVSLIKTAEEKNYELKILKAVDKVNDKQKTVLIEKIKNSFVGDYHERIIEKKTFAVWGLAFKPKTDDMREAPSIKIINELLANHAFIHAYDPEALENAKKIFGKKVKYFENAYEALKDCEALIICTEWNEFRTPDFEKMKFLLKTPSIFDGRNIYDPNQMKMLGFNYYSIGR